MMTLRRKLLVWYVGVLLIILIIFGAVMYSATRWMLIHTIDASLDATAQQVMMNANAFPVGEFASPTGGVLRLPALDAFRASGVMVQVWDVDGEVVRLAGASSNVAADAAPLDDAALVRESELRRANSLLEDMVTTAQQGGRDWRVITRPLYVWSEPYILQAALSMDTVNAASSGLLLIIAVSMILGLIGTTALGWSMANRALRRIDTITAAAGHIVNAEDLKTRVVYHGPMDEIGRLASVFNDMLGRIEHLFSVQQRFIGDISHELRTPLTAIRGNLDLVKRYGADEQSLSDMEAEVSRMHRLVSDLLMLAKADYGGISVEMHTVDLDTVVSEAYREARVLAKDRDLKIRIEDFEPVRVKGDPDRLKQLCTNLLDNAIKYTPDGGAITIDLRRAINDAEIEIHDTGIGIGEDDMKRVFDRFFQADTSRVRGAGEGVLGRSEGVGLGLSIAKWIVDAHDGSIRVTSQPGAGTTFTVLLPHLEPKVYHDMPTRRSLNALLRRAPAPLGGSESPTKQSPSARYVPPSHHVPTPTTPAQHEDKPSR